MSLVAPDTPAGESADTLARAEERVLDAAIGLSADAPWTPTLLRRAGEVAGLTVGETALLLPEGLRDLAALLARRHDRRALRALAGIDPAALKVRERIRAAVEARLEAALKDEPAVRRASLFLAHPQNAALALRLAWASADGLWRWAGDTATDANHYSKRAILSAILVSTLATALARGRFAALDHLDRRIAQVMAFEKWKAGLPDPSGPLTAAAAALARLRYGRRLSDGAASAD